MCFVLKEAMYITGANRAHLLFSNTLTGENRAQQHTTGGSRPQQHTTGGHRPQQHTTGGHRPQQHTTGANRAHLLHGHVSACWEERSQCGVQVACFAIDLRARLDVPRRVCHLRIILILDPGFLVWVLSIVQDVHCTRGH